MTSGLSDYGFRYYLAEIGRFTGVDPIADQFPHVSVYNYAENRVPGGIDLWGLQYEPPPLPSLEDGAPPRFHEREKYFENGPPGAPQIRPNLRTQRPQSESRSDNSGSNVALNTSGNSAVSSGIDLTIPSTISDGIGGLGVGLQTQGGSIRLTNGAANGNALSLRLYDSGWNGGSRARITTYQLGAAGKLVGNVGAFGTLAVGGFDIGSNYMSEGGFGTYTQQATGRTAGSLLGGYGGAAAGAAIGSLFGGVGAIPGGIIGGLIGGYGGSKAGVEAVKYIQKQ